VLETNDLRKRASLCVWLDEGPFVCDAYSAGRITIKASVREYSGKYQWFVSVWLDASVAEQTFKWESATKFDCSTPRTLSRVSTLGTKCDWTSATCSITPTT
jgi:hypothetical protein